MKTQLVKLSKTAGWIALALGVIHTANTILVVKDITALEMQWRGIFLFMYVAAGLACLLSGGAMLLSSQKEIRDFGTSNQIFLISATFMLLLGIGAPIAMSENLFGYISLFVGVFATAVAILRFKHKV
jgi:hypothetical protein